MVDILTLAGGGKQTLKRLLDSFDKFVSDIDYRHIILVQGDNDTWDYLIKHPRIKSNIHAIKNTENSKLSIAYNHLFEYSENLEPKSEYILVIDDDFELYKNAPKLIIEFLNKHNLDSAAMEHSWYGGKRSSMYIDSCGGGTLLIKRETFNKLGYLDEEYHSEWDADYTYRITKCHKMSLAICPESIKWAKHYIQVGTKRHGMEKFNILKELSMKHIEEKWGYSPKSNSIKEDKIEGVAKLDPVKRKNSLIGSKLISLSKFGEKIL